MNTSKANLIYLKIVDFDYNLILKDPHYPTSIFTLGDKIEIVRKLENSLSCLLGEIQVKRFFNFDEILMAMSLMKEFCYNPNKTFLYSDFKKYFYFVKDEIKQIGKQVKRMKINSNV